MSPLLDIRRGELHWMTGKLILPLENHLWHKPSEVMFFRSLHLPLSQFSVPVYVLRQCYQSQHHFVSSRLRNSQTGARWDGADITPSKFKSKTWQKLMKLYLERLRWFTVGTEREEQTSRMFSQVAFSLFTTSCSCHIEAVSNWPPPPIHSSIALLTACLMKAPLCEELAELCSVWLLLLPLLHLRACHIFWVDTQCEAQPPSTVLCMWDKTKKSPTTMMKSQLSLQSYQCHKCDLWCSDDND